MPAKSFLALAAACMATPALCADLKTSTQLWGEIDMYVSPAPGWSITTLLVARNGERLPNPTLWGGGIIVERRFGKLTVSAGDLDVEARNPVTGVGRNVDLPLVAMVYEQRIAGFDVSDRNRLEDLDGIPGNPWRYLNRLSVEHALTTVGAASSIFANEEVFYDFRGHEWSRSRAQFGLGLKAERHTELRLYYLRQDDRSAFPRAINALGMSLAFDMR